MVDNMTLKVKDIELEEIIVLIDYHSELLFITFPLQYGGVKMTQNFAMLLLFKSYKVNYLNHIHLLFGNFICKYYEVISFTVLWLTENS